jgi:hypothetical protein
MAEREPVELDDGQPIDLAGLLAFRVDVDRLSQVAS